MTSSPYFTPMDSHNKRLQACTAPPGHDNPRPTSKYHLLVIGAGPAGLVAAAGAAGLGAKVALVERHAMGGDCLNVGCVPSKALIHAGRRAHDVRTADTCGIHLHGDHEIDFGAIMERLRRLRANLAEADSVARFTALGVDVFIGDGHFVQGNAFQIGEARIHFAKACICTGTHPLMPPLDGLDEVNVLTNETLFSLTALPARLAIVGGGPIGCEMAQAFARLGSRVCLLEMGDQLLAREDAEAAAIVQQALIDDGVELMTRTKLTALAQLPEGKQLTLETASGTETRVVDELLMCVGRAPNVANLGLEAVGVEYDQRRGITINSRLQTTHRHIYAAGDCCSKFRFTHGADAMARLVIQNALFFGRSRVEDLVIPWCTYTDPEIAHVGQYEADDVDTYRIDMDAVDRAVLEGDTRGFLKVHCKRGSDRILGATLVSAHAGESISEISAVIAAGGGLKAIAKAIHPYPTQAECFKKAGDAFNRTRLTPFTSKLLRLLLKLKA